MTDGVNVPLGDSVPACVDGGESVGDGLLEFVADHELVALGVDRGVTAPVPETEDVALAGAPGLIVCVTVGKAVGDGDVDAVCEEDEDALDVTKDIELAVSLDEPEGE